MKILVDREWEGAIQGESIDRYRIDDIAAFVAGASEVGVYGDDRTLSAVLSALGERRLKTLKIAFRCANRNGAVTRQILAQSGEITVPTLRVINSARQTPLLGFQFAAGWLEKVAEAMNRTQMTDPKGLLTELKLLHSLRDQRLDLAVNGYVEADARFVVASALVQGWCGVGGDVPMMRVGRHWADLVGHGWTRKLSPLLHHDVVLEQINVRATDGYVVDGEFHIDSGPSVLHITRGPMVRLRELEMK